MKPSLSQIADLLLQYSAEKYFRLPPPLKTTHNLIKFLKFFFAYYDGKKQITLKNAPQYLDFATAHSGKTHLWLQMVNYGLRISLLLYYDDIPSKRAQKILAFYKKNCYKSPIILKSALDKYKFILINKWHDAQFEYCALKEINHFVENKEFPSFVSDTFEKYSVKEEILNSLKEFIAISETLDIEGYSELSEKVLKNTEILAGKIRSTYEEK